MKQVGTSCSDLLGHGIGSFDSRLAARIELKAATQWRECRWPPSQRLEQTPQLLALHSLKEAVFPLLSYWPERGPERTGEERIRGAAKATLPKPYFPVDLEEVIS